MRKFLILTTIGIINAFFAFATLMGIEEMRIRLALEYNNQIIWILYSIVLIVLTICNIRLMFSMIKTANVKQEIRSFIIIILAFLASIFTIFIFQQQVENVLFRHTIADEMSKSNSAGLIGMVMVEVENIFINSFMLLSTMVISHFIASAYRKREFRN